METSISSYGYKIKKKDLNLKQIEKIKKDLMIIPFIYDPVNNKQNTDKKFNILLESPKALYVPRFYGISNYGLPKSCKLPDGDNADLNFNGSLRDEQKPIVEAYLKASEEKGAGMISIRCGGGKTVLALHIASILKKKTIVIVHKTFLMDQWAERIRQFLPGTRIGYIQASTIDIDNKDIVIAMLQSISMKEYEDNLFESFGFSIWDEAHHLSAEVFSKAMRKISPKYLLGLSATIKRNDNTHHVFHYYLGDVVYKQADEKNKDKVECRLIQYESNNPKYSKVETIFNGNICRPRMVNNITEYKPRTDMILKYLYKYYDEGRTILILSERRDHLIRMMEEINEHYDGIVAGLYIGGIHPVSLKETENLRCILGTYSFFSEGADIKSLDTVILGSPISAVEQSIGRIFRAQGEHHKLICDFIDVNIACFAKQSEKRLPLYKKKGYELYYNENEDKEEYKKRNYKKKEKDKSLEVWESDCLL